LHISRRPRHKLIEAARKAVGGGEAETSSEAPAIGAHVDVESSTRENGAMSARTQRNAKSNGRLITEKTYPPIVRPVGFSVA
jgi:hypothetical protein